MNKKYRIVSCVFLSLLLIMGTIIAFAADDNPVINSGQVHDDDFITGGYSVTNDGTIKGDMIVGSQTLTVRGAVEGDLIGYANDINISGDVEGSIRLGGMNINISSKVNRNLMVFGSNVILNEKTDISRNAYLLGGSIKSLGTVNGKTHVFGNNVTLGGTYEGDVTINDMTEGTTFDILPGTVINGKLTYEGEAEYQIPQNVTVKSYEFIKIEPAGNQQAKKTFDFMGAVRKLVTLIVYYLFALLIYRLFPRYFVRSGDIIASKPLSAAGIGIATLGTLVGGLLLLILIFLLTLFIFKLSVFAFTGFVFLFFSIITFIFADIPVSLWLGGLITRNGTTPAKLAVGLAAITVVKFAFDLLENVPSVGSLFGVFGFLFDAGIWLLGTGALLKTLFNIFKSANIHAEMEETELETF